jgi:hypothetical protein
VPCRHVAVGNNHNSLIRDKNWARVNFLESYPGTNLAYGLRIGIGVEFKKDDFSGHLGKLFTHHHPNCIMVVRYVPLDIFILCSLDTY